jgi:drug/metabolite transporter (DMT)-like permease
MLSLATILRFIFGASMPKHFMYVCLALLAFAANSILCRYGLSEGWIDPASFTFIRLLSGAVTLIVLCLISLKKIDRPKQQHWLGASFLLVYAVTFSFAYISLDTATGALILFGTVQLLMISTSLIKGQRLSATEWCGFTLACIGFLILTAPHVTQPSWSGLFLMIIAGLGWGLYTLNGKGSKQPLMDTALNFSIATVPAVLLFVFITELHITTVGVFIAIASGALASGIGYAVWYAALPHLTTTQAATSQLLVPVIAGLGGVLLLNEAISLSLTIAACLVLGGVYLVISVKVAQ